MTTTMIRTTIQTTILLVLALAPAACDDGGKQEAKPETAKAGGKAGDKGGDKGKVEPKGGGAEVAKGGDAEADDAGADAAKGGDEEASEQDVLAALDERVQRAVKLAKEIEAKPGEASTILEAADLDREAFEALIYSIGADPELSKQYQLAMATGPEGS